MYGRIKIKINKVYFYGRHVDLVWYGKKRMKMRIKGDCGSFPWSIKDIMILDWMWLESSFREEVCM
jgi:hypothetical protein